MNNSKNKVAILFYIFIICFIILAYLYNNGALSSIFPTETKSITSKKNIIEIVYRQKEFAQDYSKKYSNSVNEIVGFEENEQWQGDYNIDDVNYWEGKSSYRIASKKE